MTYCVVKLKAIKCHPCLWFPELNVYLWMFGQNMVTGYLQNATAQPQQDKNYGSCSPSCKYGGWE